LINFPKKIPELKRNETKNWCAFYQKGRKRFAYINHRIRTSKIEVWCSGELNELVDKSKLEIFPREKIGYGWESNFPARFFLTNKNEIDSACNLLYEISYNNS